MKKRVISYWLITFSIALVCRAGVLEKYGKLPLSFEENRGQTNRKVKFQSRGLGYTLFLTSADAVLTLRHNERAAALRMRLVGANRRPTVSGLDPLPGRCNYFIGNDPKKWRTDVQTYGKVEYRDVYPGVNLIYYGNQQQLEYDFVVSAGADPKNIKLAFAGIDDLRVDASGDLVLTAGGSALRLRKPVVYQMSDGNKEAIPASYVIDKDSRQVGFELARHDAAKPLIIDPVLAYSTYIGGNEVDDGLGIAVDSVGNAYVTGWTESTDFPTSLGAFSNKFRGLQKAFVTKLNSTGSALVYSTLLGGSGWETGYSIAVDDSGNAYVTGVTSSTDFPTTSGGFDTVLGGFQDAYVTKLDATGSALVYSTFLGGKNTEFGFGIAVDSAGNAYVTGQTASTDFPTVPGSFDTIFNGGLQTAFVTKLNASGSSLTYSTFLGGSSGEFGFGIAVDGSGNAYVSGATYSPDFPTTPGAFGTTYAGYVDGFVSKLNAAGSALIYSTFLGAHSADEALAIAIDSAGNAYVTGRTISADFPTTQGAFNSTLRGSEDAFVTKLNAAGSALIYSTLLGGSSMTTGQGIAVDDSGNVYVTGLTSSTDFPTTPGALDTTFEGPYDGFATKLNATGSALAYSTFLGGNSSDNAQSIAVDALGNAYVTGSTASTDFPTTSGAFDATFNGIADVFVTKLVLASPEQLLTDLGNLISGLGIPSGTANSLLSKLQAAQASLASGDTTTACNQLQSLINEAQAQSGKKLTVADAMRIIADAQLLRISLGCP